MSSTTPREPSEGTQDFDWSWTREESDWIPPAIDTTKVSAARLYDYLLDGKDNFEVDRLGAARLLQVAPYMRDLAQANRGFLRRTVNAMIADHGIRQIIDFGTGIPTSPSVHEIANAAAPGVHVVYLDNDPVVLAHNRAILATEPGTTTLHRDVREPEATLDDPAVHALIDFTRPVGMLFVAVLHFIPLEQAPVLLTKFREAIPQGSCMAISAVCRDDSDPAALRIAEGMYENSAASLYVRTRAQIEQLFEGFRLTEPLDDITRWRNPAGRPLPMRALAGLSVKE